MSVLDTSGDDQDNELLRAGRITARASFLDLVDDIAAGDLATWRRIYATALRDPEARAAVLRASRLVEPEFANAGALWCALIARMPAVPHAEGG